MTLDYIKLDETAMDEIDCAIYSSDMFYDKENRDHLKAVLNGWTKKLEAIESNA